MRVDIRASLVSALRGERVRFTPKRCISRERWLMNARELVQTLMGLDPDTEVSVLVDRDGMLEFRPVGGIERWPSGEVVLVEDDSIDVDQARIREEDRMRRVAAMRAALPRDPVLDTLLRDLKP